MNKRDKEQIKKIMALLFETYIECDHSNFKIFPNSPKIVNELEQVLWSWLMKLEDEYNLSVKWTDVRIKYGVDEK